MFHCTIVTDKDTKTTMFDEERLIKYVMSFNVHQAKSKGKHTCTVINPSNGVTSVWHITYKPN